MPFVVDVVFSDALNTFCAELHVPHWPFFSHDTHFLDICFKKTLRFWRFFLPSASCHTTLVSMGPPKHRAFSAHATDCHNRV